MLSGKFQGHFSAAVPRCVGVIEQPTAEICVLCEDHMPKPHNVGARRSVHENELCRPVGSLHQVGMLIRPESRTVVPGR